MNIRTKFILVISTWFLIPIIFIYLSSFYYDNLSNNTNSVATKINKILENPPYQVSQYDKAITELKKNLPKDKNKWSDLDKGTLEYYEEMRDYYRK